MNFSPSNALACAQTIQALYTHDLGPNIQCADTDTQALVERVSSSSSFSFSSSSSTRPDLYGVFIPGTASGHDARTDIKIRKVKSGAGKLHRGFAGAAGSIYSDVLAAIPKGSRVILAGHSLGGAIATILADWFGNGNDYQVLNVYTFGSPRVANGPWQRCYNRLLGSRTFRVVNAGDPVPRVPWVLGTYRHVDQLVYLKNDGGIEHNPAVALASEWIQRAATVKDGVAADGAQALVRLSSHNLTSYIAKLERLDWKT